MPDGGHLENKKIVISQKPFGRFWQNFAWWHILQSVPADQNIKLLTIQDGGRPPCWKLFNPISQQPFDRFWWNLVWWCNLDLSTRWETKNFKISKSKMADGGHLESRKIAISQKPFGDFDEILHDGTWPRLCYNVSVRLSVHLSVLHSLPAVQKSNFYGGRPPFWKLLLWIDAEMDWISHDISATVCPILVKFGTVMHIRPSNLTIDQNFKNFKIQDGRRRQSWK